VVVFDGSCAVLAAVWMIVERISGSDGLGRVRGGLSRIGHEIRVEAGCFSEI